MLIPSDIPLSLYVHVPWCIRKCPYCDFNSHESGSSDLPEQEYLNALALDLQRDIEAYPSISLRPIKSVFIGGGTPSLMSAEFYGMLFKGLRERLNFSEDVEVTMEANPGTWEQANFNGFRRAGINRLSIGVQSFDNSHLQRLGRVHDSEMARKTFYAAREAGFDNINLDLMHCLPNQTIEQALDDLQQAMRLSPEHVSWYQLTIEKNTAFYKHPPVLPGEDLQWEISQRGQALLADNGYSQYEVSAYTVGGREARHNLNYWRFADYVGIGAGAHGKLTLDSQIVRTQKTRMPSDYLQNKHSKRQQALVDPKDLILEFMLNACRLTQGFPLALYEQTTGLSVQTVTKTMKALATSNLIDESALTKKQFFLPTKKGRLFVNEIIASFI